MMIEKEWTQEELAAWQERMGFHNAEAARKIGMAYKTYLDHLPGGRRIRISVSIGLLCLYVERFGSLPTAPAVKLESTERRPWKRRSFLTNQFK